ncbi:zinc-binding dehydrogenase [Achromobacter spanius]|uniref:quinone oxidoreductase family protein n=1 Tax=Achromobacter spanius TaxID=217203 RepID=UPI00320B8DD7
MRALIKTEDSVAFRDVAIPVPAATEILVRVAASSLNRADLFLVDGRSHGQHGGAGSPLGLEWAGEVVQAGSAVTRFKPGDRVMCSGLGGFAEYAVTDWRRAFPIPNATMSWEAASCLPIAVRTAHTVLTEQAGLRRGQSVLVLGASSGVGLMTLQVAKILGAGHVIGSSTSPARRERLRAYGADLTVDTSDPDWVAQVLAATDSNGVDISVDFLAGPHINDNLRAVRIGGAIVNVGRLAGESGSFDFDLHALRRIRYLGMTFRTRDVENVGGLADRIRVDLWDALKDGRLALPIDMRLPYERAVDAFEAMRNNRHFGKIVLTRAASC